MLGSPPDGFLPFEEADFSEKTPMMTLTMNFSPSGDWCPSWELNCSFVLVFILFIRSARRIDFIK